VQTEFATRHRPAAMRLERNSSIVPRDDLLQQAYAETAPHRTWSRAMEASPPALSPPLLPPSSCAWAGSYRC